jgi:hypothetical protein
MLTEPANGLEQKRSLAEFFDWYNRPRPHQALGWQTGRGLFWQDGAGCGRGGVTQWQTDAVNF